MQTQIPKKARSYSARTPLFKSLRRLFGVSRLANQRHGVPADELVEMPVRPALNRREFLRSAAVATAAVGAGSWLSGCATPKTGPNAPRIAIVGGGIAGLNAAYKLRKRGWLATIYEADKRTGGRMRTAKDLLNPGLTTELGGEFVDSGHEEMFTLAQEFRLKWLDMQTAGEEKFIREAYYFGGAHYSERQALEAFAPLAARMEADFKRAGEEINFETEGPAKELDNRSLADYFDDIGARGWFRKLLEVAFVTEFGRECSEQSALNLLTMISTDPSTNQLELFGESDERWKVVGGNQRIVDELATRLPDQVRLEHRLVAVTARDRGFTLTFDEGGRSHDVEADFVLLTLPFSMLREVDLRVPLPDWKRKAIAELGYGKNAKLMLGMKRRLWREQGHSGNIFSDEAFQLAWDNSRLQPGEAGGITCYSGGNACDELKNGNPGDHSGRMVAALEKPFPGISAEFNDQVARFHWPTHSFSKASYACYLPGQWTTIAGAEIKPVGRLFFAGEHCSLDFQGFMNGGAQTGKDAAQDLMKALRHARRAGG